MGFDVAIALACAIASLIGTGVNAYSQYKTNKQNQDINERNLDFQAAQTQAAWERDDQYFEKAVASAERAGLSPLAVNGAMQNSSPLSAPSPISMQAPQVDTNSMIQSMLQGAELHEKKRHNIEEENLRSDEITNSSKQIQLKARELDLNDKKLEEEIKYRANLIDLESKRISETERANKRNEDIKEKEYNLNKLSFESKRYFEEIKHQTGGEDVPYKVYDNYEAYLTAREIYLNAFNNFIEEVGYTRGSIGSEELSADINIMGKGSIGIGGTNKPYASEDWTAKQSAMWKNFQQKYPVPVFYYKD